MFYAFNPDNRYSSDYDFVETTGQALYRSLSSISLDRLRFAAEKRAIDAPVNLAGSFQFAQDPAGLPRTLIQTCDSLHDDQLELSDVLMIFDEVPHEKLVQLAKAGLIDAGAVFLYGVFSGYVDIEGAWDELSSLMTDTQTVLDTALLLCSYEYSLYSGTQNNVSEDNVKTLIELGANVNADGVWDKVVKEADEAICAAFVLAGANAAPYLDYIDKDSNDRDESLKDLIGHKLYSRIDDATLMQTSFMQPADFYRRIDTVYRFDLGKVVEYYYVHGARPDLHHISFADVPADTLQAMHDKLKTLGGTPPSLNSTLRTGNTVSLYKPAPKVAPKR